MTLVRVAPLGRHRSHLGSTRQELARSGECVELGAARGRARTPAEGAPGERIFCVITKMTLVRVAPLGRHRSHLGSTRQELARSGECVELGAARGRARTPAEGAPGERIFCVNPQD